MKRIAFVAVVASVGLLASPALAARSGGGKGGSSTSGGSAIWIAAVNGVTVNGETTSAATQSSTTYLGDTLQFGATVEPLAGWEYPMVDLSCYQDVNVDGTIDTNLLGPDVVFTWLDKPDAYYTLGGYSSIWTLRGGGDAVCRANLAAYGWKGGKQSIRVLKSLDAWTVLGAAA
jgi:hypothetical protein